MHILRQFIRLRSAMEKLRADFGWGNATSVTLYDDADEAFPFPADMTSPELEEVFRQRAGSLLTPAVLLSPPGLRIDWMQDF